MAGNQTIQDGGFQLLILLAELHVPRMWVEQHPDDPDSRVCFLCYVVINLFLVNCAACSVIDSWCHNVVCLSVCVCNTTHFGIQGWCRWLKVAPCLSVCKTMVKSCTIVFLAGNFLYTQA